MNEKTKDDVETAQGFINIALSLAELAGKMDDERKKGESVDVFASFHEAMDRIKYPTEDVINAEEIE